MLIEVLPEDDPEYRKHVTEGLGYIFSYAYQTGAHLAALVDERHASVYRLLFCFDTDADKDDFLRLVSLNEELSCGCFTFMTPSERSVKEAKSIVEILPPDVLQQAIHYINHLSGSAGANSVIH